jgi:hypothetical protein
MDQTPDPQMTRKVLLRAAEILELGWCRDHYCATEAGFQIDVGQAQVGIDRFCVQGAILKATQEIFGLDYSGWEAVTYAEWASRRLYWRHPVAAEAAEAVGLPLIPQFLAYLERLRGGEGAFSVEQTENARASITRWNDSVCGSAEEAIALVRATAERL